MKNDKQSSDLKQQMARLREAVVGVGLRIRESEAMDNYHSPRFYDYSEEIEKKSNSLKHLKLLRKQVLQEDELCDVQKGKLIGEIDYYCKEATYSCNTCK